MVVWKDYMKVLEPSAGRGALLPIYDDHCDVEIDIIEIDASNRDYLNKYYVDLHDNITLIGNDFMELPMKNKIYDLIIANPPFTKKTRHKAR